MKTAGLSARARAALAILEAGGHFRYGLETNGYTKREQFQWRLKSARGSTMKGYGSKTYHELAAAGADFESKPQGFTGIATHYHLRKKALAPDAAQHVAQTTVSEAA